VKSVGEPVVIDGVTVAPGDILVADDDGAVAVPASRWDEVLRIAERIEAVEDEIVASVQAGATLREARAQHGYHSLQTRES
jgi:regulator of RNase E activity RraA